MKITWVLLMYYAKEVLETLSLRSRKHPSPLKKENKHNNNNNNNNNNEMIMIIIIIIITTIIIMMMIKTHVAWTRIYLNNY